MVRDCSRTPNEKIHLKHHLMTFGYWLFIGSLTASYALGFLVRTMMKRQRLLDVPNQRSSHVAPKLRGGGVGIVLTIALGCILMVERNATELGLLASMALVATVSFIDDRISLPWMLRLIVQSVAASLVLFVLWTSTTTTLPISGSILCALAIVAYSNVFNFMDGIDGIASMQAIMTAGAIAAIAYVSGGFLPPVGIIAVLVAGATAGFLPHNFPKSLIFLGDVGSVSLGFILSFLTVWLASQNGWWLLYPLCWIHANFVLDAGITLFRRFVRGAKLSEAHREHFYQKLIQKGRPHWRVTIAELTIQMAVIPASIFCASRHPSIGLLSLLSIAVGLIWGAFFVFCELTPAARE